MARQLKIFNRSAHPFNVNPYNPLLCDGIKGMFATV